MSQPPAITVDEPGWGPARGDARSAAERPRRIADRGAGRRGRGVRAGRGEGARAEFRAARVLRHRSRRLGGAGRFARAARGLPRPDPASLERLSACRRPSIAAIEGRALELMLTGREIRGTEAWRIGLIERLLPRDVVEQSLEIATALTACSSSAMAAAMICVDAARDLPRSERTGRRGSCARLDGRGLRHRRPDRPPGRGVTAA